MSIVDDVIQRVETLLDNWNVSDAQALGSWIGSKFILKPARTPSDQKMNLWQMRALVQALNYAHEAGVREHWPRTKAEALPAVAAKFSLDAQPEFIREVTVNGVRYQNLKSLPQPSFMKMVKTIDATFASIGGWRRKALSGSPTVAFAGPEEFRGSAKARYNDSSDTMFVRATPAVVRRTGVQYASFEYILVHELGHRYERFHRPPGNFSTSTWVTTPYSQTEGMTGSEAFAELFALGHFGITSWGPREFGSIIERFEDVMSGASRVAARYLQGTFQAPHTIIRDKGEAEELVKRFTPIEREILTHLFHHGTVVTDTGSHATLGPPAKQHNPRPQDYKKIQSGFMVVRDLERTKWVNKTPAGGQAFNWVLTREAEAVFKLANPRSGRRAALDFSEVLAEVTRDDLVEVNETYIFDVGTLRKSGRKTIIKGIDGSGQHFELVMHSKGGTLKFEEDGEAVSLPVDQFRVV